MTLLKKKICKRIAVTLVVSIIAAFFVPDALVSPDGNTTTVVSYASTERDFLPGISESGVFGYAKIHDLRTSRSSGSDRVNTKKSSSGISHRSVQATSKPYNDDFVDRIGSTMSDQLSAAFGGGLGTKATITDVTSTELASINSGMSSDSSYVDILSKVTFQFPTSYIPADVLSAQNKSDAFLYYIEQAISRYPRLCCLFTMLSLSITDSTAILTVYSPIAKDSMANTTARYEADLNAILKVPLSNTSMNETDKLLYLHDEVVAMTEYSTGRSGIYAIDYIPVGAMINNLGVCQSYAAVFNQAARKMGLNCYVVDSYTHAWNAVLLGGYWYYIDTTWDDTRSYGQDRDYIRHDYLLVNNALNDSFASSHQITEEYNYHFPFITEAMGSGYDSFFPKSNAITSQMGYIGGYFYYSKDNKLYRWRQGETSGSQLSAVSVVASRRISVVDGLIFISGSDGIYKSDSGLSAVYKEDSSSYSGMYEAAGRLYVSKGGSYYIYYDGSSSTASAAPTSSANPWFTSAPGASASPGATHSPVISPSAGASATPRGIPTVPPSVTPTGSALPGVSTTTPVFTPEPSDDGTPIDDSDISAPSFTRPPQTYIKKLKNIKKRAAFIKWKKIKAVSKYQVQYSPNRLFATKQTRNSLTNSVTIANLYKNKTYYFRVRAVKIKRGSDGAIYYKYAKWSTKQKVRIKT